MMKSKSKLEGVVIMRGKTNGWEWNDSYEA